MDALDQEFKVKMKIPGDHTLVQTDTTWKQKSGQDTDTYWYDELNPAGEVVGKWVVYDSTSMHPPFGRSVQCEKVG